MFLRKDLADLGNLSRDELCDPLTDSSLTDEEYEALVSVCGSAELIEEVTSPAGTAIPAGPQAELPTINESGETIGETAFQIQRSEQESPTMTSSFKKFKTQNRVTIPGDYRKATELGHGGQGVVYLIEGEDEFSAAYALKVFSPEAYENQDEFAGEMKRMQRIASLIHHEPHDDLVEIGWFGQREGVYTMLMQYIDGFDLRRLLEPELLPKLQSCVGEERWKDISNVVYSVNGTKQLALRPAIAVYIIERVLRGLAALHSRDIIHGDIKPSNIMLNAASSLKIIDIGSAFEVHLPPTRHHYTPAYVAPEFLESETMSKQSDLASVGYMLIELLSGKPITADTLSDTDKSTRSLCTDRRHELLKAKKSLPDRLPEILPRNILACNHLVELCRCLIHPDLNRRFSSAAECIVDRKGTYQFNKGLMLADLGICNYYEVGQWLANVKQAMRSAREGTVRP
jgi:serine/threonine-protein kinase